MNLQELTIEQKQAIVALKPMLDARYQHLRGLLDKCTEVDVPMWEINLALTDIESVLEVMLPRIDNQNEEGY